MEFKNLKINKEVHKMLKEYCKDNGLKVNHLASSIIKDFLEKIKKDKKG